MPIGGHTVLPGVRHAFGRRSARRFIPWDDDIDVGMLRPDYERFLKVAPKALGERYAVCEPRANSRCAGMFAKFGSVARSSSRRKPWRRESIRHLRGRVPLRHPPCRRERCYSADSAMSSMAKRVLPAARSACDRAPLRHPWCARKRCLLGCHVGAKAFLNHERVVRSSRLGRFEVRSVPAVIT